MCMSFWYCRVLKQTQWFHKALPIIIMLVILWKAASKQQMINEVWLYDGLSCLLTGVCKKGFSLDITWWSGCPQKTNADPCIPEGHRNTLIQLAGTLQTHRHDGIALSRPQLFTAQWLEEKREEKHLVRGRALRPQRSTGSCCMERKGVGKSKETRYDLPGDHIMIYRGCPHSHHGTID